MRERGERQKLILTRHRKRHRDCQTDGKREIYIYSERGRTPKKTKK